MIVLIVGCNQKKEEPAMSGQGEISAQEQTTNSSTGLDIGKQAPNFSMTDSEGKTVSLSSLKGNVVMIDFWATWCPPCVRSIPEVKKLWAEHKGKQFQVLGVSLDKDLEVWKSYIKENNMTWKQVADGQFWDNKAALAFGIASIPSVWILDKEGKIVIKDANPLSDDDLIKETITKLLQ